MKKLLLLPLVAAFALTACSGTIDPNEHGNIAAPYTLSVDKTQIESDGTDMATFTIKDANGTVLTDADHIRNTSFQIVELNEWRSGVGSDEAPNTFSSITDGTYTVKAMYNGEYCQNEVTVTSQNRSAYEKFHKNVLLYRFTATWCAYCPSMTTALEKVNDYTKDHSVIMQIHGNDEFAMSAMSSWATDIYNTQGYPYCDYSLTGGSTKRTVNDIQRFVKDVLYTCPAKTGIKAVTSLEGDVIKVDATIQASADGEYDLAVAVVKDGCVPASTDANESVYDNVLVGITANYRQMSSGTPNMKKGTERQVFVEIPASSYKAVADKCEIILFTLTKVNGKVVVDNATTVKVGESVDYKYN
jgi:thiol-disulfide isomerase/thioredoxin